MTYDKDYYQKKKLDISSKFQKAQQKWFRSCEISGQEYIDFQTRVQELQADMKAVEEEEAKSKAESEKVIEKKK